MDVPLALVKPNVGVVTNVESDHFSAYRTKEAIAIEKGKLIGSLPPSGIAVLNADDLLVMGMGERFTGRIVTFGLTDNAMLRGDSLQSVWPQRFSLNVTWQGKSQRVQTQLCGTHWAPTVLAALATGVALGMPLANAADAIVDLAPFEGRMEPVEVDGITFMRDDWKAPLSTIASAFEVMRQAQAKRKIIVVGTISDYPGDSARRYVKIAKDALAIADCVVFVGPWASAALKAKRNSSDHLVAFSSLQDASNYLWGYLAPGDLVLLKGSAKADHLQRVILARTESAQCWLPACQRNQFCDVCELMHVPSGGKNSEGLTQDGPNLIIAEKNTATTGEQSSNTDVIVIGLGNPEAKFADTPHNFGYRTVDQLALKMGQPWQLEGDLAMLAKGNINGITVRLVKPLSAMNDIGPTLVRLAETPGFEGKKFILVHDDIDLPFGVVKMRQRGGDGGHRGVRSILQAFQDDRFRRVKIGVGPAPEGQSVIDFVLTPFPEEERAVVETINRAAADKIIEIFCQEGTTQ